MTIVRMSSMYDKLGENVDDFAADGVLYTDTLRIPTKPNTWSKGRRSAVPIEAGPSETEVPARPHVLATGKRPEDLLEGRQEV